MTNEIDTLIRQIGNGTLAMLGASALVSSETTGGDPVLQFKIRGCKEGNKLRITYRRALDAYDVELWHVRGTNVFEVASTSLVYADALHATIERLTGLRTRL